MKKSKSSLSKAESIEKIGEFWDQNDLSDHWEKTHEVDCSIELESERFLFPLDITLLEKIRKIAKSRGVSIETLLNLWIQEKTTKVA